MTWKAFVRLGRALAGGLPREGMADDFHYSTSTVHAARRRTDAGRPRRAC